jgi:hypothetical protein
MVGHAVTCAVDNDPTRWDEIIRQQIWFIRTRKHQTTGFSPFKLVFGVEPRLIGDMEPPRQSTVPLDAEERREAILERTIEELEQMGYDRAAAYKRTMNQAERMKSKNQLENEGYRFEIGDWVKRKRMDKTKFETHWFGPFIIAGFGFPGTYWLMHPDGTRLDNLVNQSHLRKWLSRSDSEDEREDRDLVVESIPPERGNSDNLESDIRENGGDLDTNVRAEVGDEDVEDEIGFSLLLNFG